MMFPKINHIYVVHRNTNNERYKVLKTAFDHHFDEKFYTFKIKTDKDDISDEIIDKYYTRDADIRTKEMKIITESPETTDNISAMNDASLSRAINHISIWEDVIKSDHQRVLILEDDMLFMEDTVSYMIEIMAEIQDKVHGIVSLDDGYGKSVESVGIEPDSEKTLYKIENGCMRSTGAYIIDKATCNKLVHLNQKRKFSLELDKQLSMYGALGVIDVYWSDPVCFSNGLMYSHDVREKEIVEQIKYDNMLEFENKKMICIGNHNLSNCNQLIQKLDCSCLFFNIKKNQHLDVEKYPIKYVTETPDNSSISGLIKKHYFDGDIDILFIEDCVMMIQMVMSTIIVNPKVIICHFNNKKEVDQTKELLKKRYIMNQDNYLIRSMNPEC